MIHEPAGAAAFGEPAPVRTRAFVPETATAMISRSFADAQANAFIAAAGVRTLRKAGSSLKFCLIAAGEADIYPRFGAINEWDIAAGDAVLRAAGGIVAQTNGLPVVYGNPAFSTPPFIAFGDRIAAARLTNPKDV